MDYLGIYLLVSLVFVVGIMVEFAIALLVHRYSEKKIVPDTIIDSRNQNRNKFRFKRKNQNQIGLIKKNAYDNACHLEQQTWRGITANTIDIAASVLFPLAYIIFNAVYWCAFN